MKLKLLVIIIILAVASVSIALYATESFKCAIFNFQNCDVSCSADSDCKESNCYCVNIRESVSNCHLEFPSFMYTCVSPSCIAFKCECVDGKCTANIQNPVFKTS